MDSTSFSASPYNRIPEVTGQFRLSGEIILNDNSVREGEQASDVSLGVDGKLKVLRRLAEIGVRQAQCGYTGKSKSDREIVQRVRDEDIPIKLEGIAFKDGLSAETTNGSISLAITSPETLNADLSARVTNGHITVDFPITLQNLSGSKRRVEGKIGQGGPEISLHTTNGSISLNK